mgnify:CR=1 FL=1
MTKRKGFTAEFKREAALLATGRQIIAAAARSPRVSEQTPCNWVTPRRQRMDEASEWLPWHNRTRIHSTLACLSPLRFKQDWLAAAARKANSRLG